MELLDSKFNVDNFLRQFELTQRRAGENEAEMLSSAPEVVLQEENWDEPSVLRFGHTNPLFLQRNCLKQWRMVAAVEKYGRMRIRRLVFRLLTIRYELLRMHKTILSEVYQATLIRVSFDAFRTVASARLHESHFLRLYFYRWQRKWRQRVRVRQFIENGFEKCIKCAFDNIVRRFNQIEITGQAITFVGIRILSRKAFRALLMQNYNGKASRFADHRLARRAFLAIVANYNLEEFCFYIEWRQKLKIERRVFEHISVSLKVEAVQNRLRCITCQYIFWELRAAAKACRFSRHCSLLTAFELLSKSWFKRMQLYSIAFAHHDLYLKELAFARLVAVHRAWLEQEARAVRYRDLKLQSMTFRIVEHRATVLQSTVAGGSFARIQQRMRLFCKQNAFSKLMDLHKLMLFRQLHALKWNITKKERRALNSLLRQYKTNLQLLKTSLLYNRKHLQRQAFTSICQCFQSFTAVQALIGAKYDHFFVARIFQTWRRSVRKLTLAGQRCEMAFQRALVKKVFLRLLESQLAECERHKIALEFDASKKLLVSIAALQLTTKRMQYIKQLSVVAWKLGFMKRCHHIFDVAEKEKLLTTRHRHLTLQAFFDVVKIAIDNCYSNVLRKRKILIMWRKSCGLKRRVGADEFERILLKKLREYSD